MRPLRASYRFAWSGFTSGKADIRFAKRPDNNLEIEASGQSTGLVRAIWRFDAKYSARADAVTLRPIEMQQVDTIRPKRIVTDLKFSRDGVISTRREKKHGSGTLGPPWIRRFDYPDLFDWQTAILYLRSQPLKDGSVERIVIYPAKDAYLVTITVLGRERLSVPAGTYDAIKFDLQIKKIGKKRQLEPHRKFRRGTLWISDDADRIFLRAEAQVFVGTVTAELKSVQFEKPE